MTAQRGVTRRAAVEALAAVQALPGVTGFYAGDAFAARSARRDVPGTYLGVDVLAAAEVLESAISLPGHPAAAVRTIRRTVGIS